jgi:hypothetical protein
MKPALNYTPIDDLIKKIRLSYVSLPKEAEPIQNVSDEPMIDESLIKETEIEHEIPKEVQPYITVNEDALNVSPNLQRFGLKPVSPTGPSIFQSVKLPITDDKVIEGLHKPITSSWRWLSELSLYLLHHAHLALRTIHGHVVRVVR